MKSPFSTLMIIAAMTATPAAANDDFVKGLMGAMIGAAIANSASAGNQSGTRQRSSSGNASAGSGMSAETRANNKAVQEALNSFGFAVGTPDGVLGRRSQAAISQLQACIGRPITGALDPFEDQFLKNSYFKSQVNPTETLRIVASKPNGYCGLLQQYHQELLAPAPAAAATTTTTVTQTAPAQAPAAQTVVTTEVQQGATVVNTVTNNNTTVLIIDEATQARYDMLLSQLKLLEQIQKHVEAKATDAASQRKLATVVARLDELRGLVTSVEVEVQGKYGTPIRPTNANLGVTAAKASEVFPRVPYYIPGTEETGELWVKPYVTDAGQLMYDFNVVAQSDFDKIKDTIEMTSDNVRQMADALVRVTEWSDKAVEQGLRRNYEKSAICFPKEMCGKNEEGANSAEVFFVIYEDGSTAARLQENKGKFRSAYNLSIESGLLLAAYLDYMAEIGEKEFEANVMTDTDLDALFE